MNTFAMTISFAGITPLRGRFLDIADLTRPVSSTQSLRPCLWVPLTAPLPSAPPELSWITHGEEPDWFFPSPYNED